MRGFARVLPVFMTAALFLAVIGGLWWVLDSALHLVGA
jgi:hypothetical protein